MKAIITLLAGMSAAVLYSSCSDYSSTYYERGNGTHGYSTAHVSIIRTSNSCWGYDPYRRAYYDYRCKRYYDYNRGCYHTKIPYRYSSAVYPTSYRSGRAMSCPQRLTKVSYRGHRAHQQPSHGQERYKRDSHYPTSRSVSYRNTSSSSRSDRGRISTVTRPLLRDQETTRSAQPGRIHKVPSTQQVTRATLSRVETARSQPKARPQTTRPAPTRTQTRQPAPRVQRSQPAPQPKGSPRPSSSRSSGKASRSQRR